MTSICWGGGGRHIFGVEKLHTRCFLGSKDWSHSFLSLKKIHKVFGVTSPSELFIAKGG